jgi:E3 ubiquitin-protein ligase FANCL
MIILDKESGSFLGFISTRNGLQNFSILAREVDGTIDVNSLRLDDALSSILNSVKDEVWFRERLSKLISAYTIAEELQTIVNQIQVAEARSGRNDALKEDSAYSQILMNHLDMLGWNRVLHIDENFTVIQMKSEDSRGHSHVFDVEINPGYPFTSPTVRSSLPTTVDIQWSSNQCDLRDIVRAVDKEMKRYEGLFQVLSEIDDNLIVIEPSPPTFAVTYRRIIVERSCSVMLEVDPVNPRAVGELRFYGPSVRTSALRALVGQNIHKWSTSKSITENLESLLELKLPLKETESNRKNEQPLVEECGICYTYAIPMDGMKETSIPDQVCSNPKCCKNFHTSCLVDWLQALPSSKTSFGTLFGSCPYCHEPMTVRL